MKFLQFTRDSEPTQGQQEWATAISGFFVFISTLLLVGGLSGVLP